MKIKRVCSIPDCGQPHYCRQLCVKHYSAHKKAGTLPPHIRRAESCLVTECNDKPKSGGYCGKHHHRLVRYGDPTAGPGRGSPGRARGKKQMRGEYICGEYRRIRVVPTDGSKARWVLEHRHVMEQSLGRPLLSEETVHHKRPSEKLNNDPSNLELWSSSQPRGGRVSDLVEWAREILALYGPLVPVVS